MQKDLNHLPAVKIISANGTWILGEKTGQKATGWADQDSPHELDIASGLTRNLLPRSSRREISPLIRGRDSRSKDSPQFLLDRRDHLGVGRLDLGREHRGDAAVAADQVLVEIPARTVA